MYGSAFARGVVGVLFLASVLCFFADNALAGGLATPKGPVVLTISGGIVQQNGPDGASFDRSMLEAVGIVSVETKTHFTEGVQRFEGVRLAAVLAAVGATGTTLRAQALDGYDVDIPFSDAARFEVLLAMRWNGRTMRVREKGPIWVVYPIDAYPETNTEIYSARSVWQLRTLTVQ